MAATKEPQHLGEMVDLMKSVVDQKGKKRLYFGMTLDPLAKAADDSLYSTLSRSRVERLAFETDPALKNNYQSIYKAKLRGIPDTYLKQIAIQDSLVAEIVQARCAQMSAFGRPRPTRFDTGFILEPRAGIVDNLSDEQKAELDERIEKAIKRITNCGEETSDWHDHKRMTFTRWLETCTRSALICGRLATEIVWRDDPSAPTGKRFDRFLPIDSATIYQAVPQSTAGKSIRTQALKELKELQGKDSDFNIDPQKFSDDEYVWIQVIAGRPKQAFTSTECVVQDFYPVADVEWDGYPITPLDTVITEVTTHLNITNHNKLYFQSGRATRGMLVLKSEDVDPEVINQLRMEFQSVINGAQNSWRLPVFGIGAQDTVEWTPLDAQGQRDAEFQYLADSNARTILTAFQMSPEELPGWSYLSRGTNSQALSEGNNEYKLEAARDLGIRPLIAKFEDFVNSVVLPLIDPELATMVEFQMAGLDADSPEKEATRLAQDVPLHYTYDQLLQKVEKKPVGKELGGEFPLNPAFQQILKENLPFGVIQEKFFGVKGASKDPNLAFYQNEHWFKWQEMQQQAAALQMQQQQMQAAQQGQANTQGQVGGGAAPNETSAGDPNSNANQGAGNADPARAGGDGGTPTEKQKTADAQGAAPGAEELKQNLEGAMLDLSKAEKHLPNAQKRLLQIHADMVNRFLKGFQKDAEGAVGEIMTSVDDLLPKG